MGLDVSHDAFSGAYSAFNRFRQAIAKAISPECSFPPHDNRALDDSMIYFPDDLPETKPGLYEFLLHSDCDGEISPELCDKLADEMETLLPNLMGMGESGGHLSGVGGYASVAQKFIEGCREAADKNEPLEFM